MASAKITMVGGAKAKARVKRIVPAIELELRKVLIDDAREIVEAAVEEINKPKTGRFYRGKFRGTQTRYQWRASAPGEAPAKRTGENVERIGSKRWNRKHKPGAKIQYPNIYRLLARGMGGTRPVAPRPLFAPIMAKRRAAIRDKVESTTRRVLSVEVRRK
jgi:hypothetical protein